MPTLDTVDHYGECEAGVMNLLRALSYFSTSPDKQVSDNRLNVNRGAEHWAIFYPSTFTARKLDPRSKVYSWRIVFDLYVRFKTAEEAPGKFRAVRSGIINWLDANPTLAGVPNVEEVLTSAQGELLQDAPGDNPNFLLQTMAVTVIQRVNRKF